MVCTTKSCRCFGSAILLVPLFAATGCPAPEGTGDWVPLFQGIDYYFVVQSSPVPLRVHAVRIDLTGPEISIFVTPPSDDGPGEVDSLRTSSFVEFYDLQVAVNASPFSPLAGAEGRPMDVVGLSVSEGLRYSEPEPGYGALVFNAANGARIVTEPMDVVGAFNGVGGFEVILRDGENLGADGPREPRTAAGIPADGTVLYLVVIDGRQPFASVGATTEELAGWMIFFGADEALNLDGGGSTTLAADDGSGNAAVLNRPVQNHIAGLERPVANHLGIFAAPLP